MKVVYGNIWDYPADVVCIPTNGAVRTDGACVMGRRVAGQAKHKYPGIDMKIGSAIRSGGNRVYMMGSLCTFPVKHKWWEEADPILIHQSALSLTALANEYSSLTFVLARPGCGNGRLEWKQVGSLLECLPDNVHVITNEVGAGR